MDNSRAGITMHSGGAAAKCPGFLMGPSVSEPLPPTTCCQGRTRKWCTIAELLAGAVVMFLSAHTTHHHQGKDIRSIGRLINGQRRKDKQAKVGVLAVARRGQGVTGHSSQPIPTWNWPWTNCRGGEATRRGNWAKLVLLVNVKPCLTGFLYQFQRQVGQFHLIPLPHQSLPCHMTFVLRVSVALPTFKFQGPQETVGEKQPYSQDYFQGEAICLRGIWRGRLQCAGSQSTALLLSPRSSIKSRHPSPWLITKRHLALLAWQLTKLQTSGENKVFYACLKDRLPSDPASSLHGELQGQSSQLNQLSKKEVPSARQAHSSPQIIKGLVSCLSR